MDKLNLSKVTFIVLVVTFFLSSISVSFLMADNRKILGMIGAQKVNEIDNKLDERSRKNIEGIYTVSINSNKFSTDVFSIIAILCGVWALIIADNIRKAVRK